MFLQPFEIDRKSLVADIVCRDYRAADVFRRYGIGYCCGGKWPLDMACEMQGVDPDKVQEELKAATRTVEVSNQLDFGSWSIDFLVDYIIHVHHAYLQKSLPETQEMLSEFAKEHARKYTYLVELEAQFDILIKQLLLSMQREEEVLFPYIRRIAHAHKNKEPYAVLLVRTLRKPIEETMFRSHETISNMLFYIRSLTNEYVTPENVCTTHKVVIARLKELDNDIMQHLYLEKTILFPRALAIEMEMLSR